MIRLFVGLGNPGTEYEATRHNAGFWWIDTLAQRWQCVLQPDRVYHGLVARSSQKGSAVWLLQPMTYMNLSGKSVAALARFFKIEVGEILVVHDELDLLPGQVKLKLGGSAAGHNGLKDIQAQMGSPDHWRLRLGIGHPGIKSDVAGYVLRKPPAAEREAIDGCIAKSMDGVEAMLDGDMAQALARIHAQPPRPKPPRPAPLSPAAAPSAAEPAAPAASPPAASKPD